MSRTEPQLQMRTTSCSNRNALQFARLVVGRLVVGQRNEAQIIVRLAGRSASGHIFDAARGKVDP